jgi:hypothetical protein
MERLCRRLLLGWNKLEKSERVGVGARVDAMTERGPGGGMGSIGSVAMAMGGGATGGKATGSGVSATVTVKQKSCPNKVPINQ